MTLPLWQMDAPAFRVAVMQMDARFQRAMRRIYSVPKAAHTMKPTPPAKPEKRVRDVLTLATPIHKLPFSPAAKIIAEVCEKHRVSKPEIMGMRREKMLVRARHEAFYRLKTETTLSLPAIGVRMGGRDHSTVHHGIRRHIERISAQ